MFCFLVFDIKSCDGIELFPDEENARNKLIVLVDPKKNIITILKNTHKREWY